jgi:heavy metal translocating P-type ATPase
MWCTSCAWLIERALLAEKGVLAAEAMFASDVVRVRYSPQHLPPSRIADSIRSLGYAAEECRGLEGRTDDTLRRDLLLRLGVAAFLWINVMTLSFVIYVGYFEAVHPAAGRLMPFLLMALSAPAVFWSAQPVLRAAWLGVRQLAVRVELLLALGMCSAWAYSAVEAISGGQHIYFDTACAISTLVLAGKLLEHGAKQRASRAVGLLYRTMPRKARLVLDGQERFVATEELRQGMIFAVRPGERIPADGIVVEGASHVDESMVTGESAPVRRGGGDRVLGGSLNSDGVLRVQATSAGGGSTLGNIISAVGSALTNRSQAERTADGAARAFVPAVIALALFTFVYFGLKGDAGAALIRAIAVLVIACPCSLGIATPLALTATVGRAASRGILVNDVRALETIRRVDVLVLDKTGTVTEGEFQLLETSPPELDRSLLASVASLEANSEHPIGRAMARWASQEGLRPLAASGVRVRKGAGIEGKAGGREIFAGNRALAAERGARIPVTLEAVASGWQNEGHSVVFVGCGTSVCGALALGDRIRPDAASLVRGMASRGIRTLLVSGDSEATTAAVARAIGVSEFRGAVQPGVKSAVVRELQQHGLTVAMVGDGINDAPALACADLGIALGSGTDLAMKAAPVVLMNNSLDRIPEVFDLARRALAVVRQNLFWAFAYNTVGISLAVAGILNPIVAAGAMVLSSLSVIANSLRVGRPRDRWPAPANDK